MRTFTNLIRAVALGLFVGATPVLVLATTTDMIEFHRLSSGDYKTPWYSASWLKQPYTNLRLALLPAREYWTTNANGSERWFVREVTVGDVTFWTALQRTPIDKPFA